MSSNEVSPIEWLDGRVEGFSQLSDTEREAIMHFSLLWSFFEGKALGTHANAGSIVRLTHRWAESGNLRMDAFEDSLIYFQRRYFDNGKPTDYFRGLHFRSNDKESLVRAVLNGEDMRDEDIVSGLLIIILRFRNNFFHGIKWAYGIRGQLSNFNNANVLLMAALDMHDRCCGRY